MDPLKALSIDFHTTAAASLLRQAFEAPNNQQQARYREETFPIMVRVESYNFKALPIICSSREPYAAFLADLRRILKIDEKQKTSGVAWQMGNEYGYGRVTPENLHVVLRMMQMRPCQGFFKILMDGMTGNTHLDSSVTLLTQPNRRILEWHIGRHYIDSVDSVGLEGDWLNNY